MSQAANRRGLYLGRRSARVHVAVYRLTRGRVGGHLPGFRDVPIVLVDHVGARSGKRRTSPLIAHEHEGLIAVAASKAGQPTHPAWFHNLMANPETVIQLGREIRPVRARKLAGAERDLWWQRLRSTYAGYDFFQQLAGAREIPVVVLEPRTSG
jgi:deazaflavin-dependent oxidoreductase (nitroreductase family)